MELQLNYLLILQYVSHMLHICKEVLLLNLLNLQFYLLYLK